MSIFQKSVINKHLQNLDNEQVEKVYQKFRENYNSAKIEEIKKLKEEQYQDGFLRDIFVDVFGYTLAPDENHNLEREFKNVSDSKKADGAIIKEGKAIAVIELKSTKTKDLKSVTEQAFGYKYNQPDCRYVIISNFQKLQFYIDYANEYEEFDLFNLQKDDFELLYLLLNKDSVFSDLPLTLKTETKFHEENISDKLYKDYSIFKRKLFENLIKNNPQYDKLTLFKKSQKLLDRFLFILFAEDSGLLPPNSITRIIEKYNTLIELDEYKPVYEIYKQYFGYMNIGRKGKTEADRIPAYNGGLFYPDELLDSLIIDDDILISDLLNLSEYDFNTEVDVNILGHIFEHSLNEIEEITAEIEGTPRDKSKSKRKKDGVFYTPKYITQYIVENTVGTLCKEKRKEFGITEIEFDGTYKTKDGRLSAKGKKLFETLEKYKEWLLSLKIVDPACGSGAFLNQALNFLIAEHKSIDDIIAELTDTPLRLFDTDKSILENNLYGVDINEESVEIAKLSLWLRTAHRDRKLSNLNNNIKCGNSLIDDPEVAGDKAFNWQKEFPQIFHEKKKEAWHITTATHNSRYSQRMFDYHITTGEAIWIDEEAEIIITETIAEIVKDDNLNVIEYNICGDHMHLLLVCEKEEVSKIVGKLKGVSAKKYNIAKGITIPSASEAENGEEGVATAATKGHVPLSEEGILPSSSKKKYNSLWTQKFGTSRIKDEEYLRNAISYIRNNRKKHGLPKNKKLSKIIDEMICTTEHAFRTEYSGGFDVVIGNPPYLRVQGLRENFWEKSEFYKKYYKSATGRFDIYVLFMERSFELINKKGLASFILPHKFLVSDFGEGIRSFFVKNRAAKSILLFGSEIVFADASTYTCIINLSRNNSDLKFKQIKPSELFNSFNFELANYNSLSKEKWNLMRIKSEQIFDKLNSQLWTVKDVFKNISQGIVSVGDDIFLMKGKITGENFIGFSEKINNKIILESEVVKPLLKGEDVKKYSPLQNKYFCLYPHYEKDGKTIPFEENYFKEKYPLAYSYILPFKDELIQKKIKYKTNPKAWYSLHRSREISLFEQKKIVTPETSLGGNLTIDTSYYFHNTQVYSLIKNNSVKEDYKFWTAILNSSLFWFYLQSTGAVLRGGYFRFKTKYLEPFPLPKLQNIEQQNPFIEKADRMLGLNKQFKQKKNTFLSRVKDNFEIEKISKKLNAFYDFDFKTFIAELKKQKVKISLNKQVEWEEFFNKYKTEINTLQTEIDKTDQEIDQMVYELYGLTEEEIEIVENSTKGN